MTILAEARGLHHAAGYYGRKRRWLRWRIEMVVEQLSLMEAR